MERQPRQRHTVGDQTQILDLDFDLIRTDARAAIHEIYAVRGQTLSSTAEAGMTAWEQTNHARPGPYPHPAEYYGLTTDAIETAFADYRQRFAN